MKRFLDRNGEVIELGDIVEISNGLNPVTTTCVEAEDGSLSLIDSADGCWDRQLFHEPERLNIVKKNGKEVWVPQPGEIIEYMWGGEWEQAVFIGMNPFDKDNLKYVIGFGQYEPFETYSTIRQSIQAKVTIVKHESLL